MIEISVVGLFFLLLAAALIGAAIAAVMAVNQRGKDKVYYRDMIVLYKSQADRYHNLLTQMHIDSDDPAKVHRHIKDWANEPLKTTPSPSL